MSWLKVLILCLAAVHTAAAFDVMNPFSWKAVEDAERHLTGAVVSLYTDTVRLQKRVKEHVFAPDVADTPLPSECKASPGPLTYHPAIDIPKLLLVTVVAVPAAFIIGWICGVRQAQFRQALQQARAADQQAEALVGQQTDAAAASSESQQVLPDSGAQATGSLTPLPYSVPHAQPLHTGEAKASSAVATALSSVSGESDVTSETVRHQASCCFAQSQT